MQDNYDMPMPVDKFAGWKGLEWAEKARPHACYDPQKVTLLAGGLGCGATGMCIPYAGIGVRDNVLGSGELQVAPRGPNCR